MAKRKATKKGGTKRKRGANKKKEEEAAAVAEAVANDESEAATGEEEPTAKRQKTEAPEEDGNDGGAAPPAAKGKKGKKGGKAKQRKANKQKPTSARTAPSAPMVAAAPVSLDVMLPDAKALPSNVAASAASSALGVEITNKQAATPALRLPKANANAIDAPPPRRTSRAMRKAPAPGSHAAQELEAAQKAQAAAATAAVDDGDGGGNDGQVDLSSRLAAIRSRLSQVKRKNHDEVIEEDLRLKDPTYAKRKAFHERRLQEAKFREESGKPTKPQTDEEKRAAAEARLLRDNADAAAWRKKKRTKAKPVFGHEVHAADSNYRSYEKRIATELNPDLDAYEAEQARLAAGSVVEPLYGATVSETARARLVEAMKAQEERRKKFSRRRIQDDDGVVHAINRKNLKFVNQATRAFDPYTVEIRANLERGTAL